MNPESLTRYYAQWINEHYPSMDLALVFIDTLDGHRGWIA